MQPKKRTKVHRKRTCTYGCCISLQFQNLSSCRLSSLSLWFQRSRQTRVGSLVPQAKAFGDSLCEAFFCILMGPPFQKLQNPTVLSKEKFFLLQMSTNALQVTSVTVVRHVTIQMAPTRAHVTAASRGMDEPVEVRAFE